MLVDKYEVYTSDFKWVDLEDYKDNSHVVIYSGGCDSTLLLYELSKKFGTKKNPVKALSFNYVQAINPRKIKTEKKTRNSFKQYCKKNKIYVDFLDINITTNRKYDKRACESYSFNGIAQPYLWLTSLSTILLGKHNIYFGYIKEDDFWFFKTEFINAFNALQKITGTESRLIFAYSHAYKKNIIKELNENKIYEYTWHCEMPTDDNKRCGTCHPCKKHDQALKQIAEEEQEEKEVQEKVEE